MARHKLTDTRARSLSKPGIFSDGDGLYLRVQKSGKSWVFIWHRFGRRREIGLGAYGSGAGQVSLAAARAKAEEARAIVGRGGDPKTDLAERQAAAATFGEVADQFVETMGAKWRSPKTLAAWQRFASTYAKPLRPVPVDKVATDDVVSCLRGMWRDKPETAAKTREKIALVLDHAKARGLRTGDNPAQWKGHLDQILPSAKQKIRQHLAAAPYAEVPAIVERLRGVETIPARALEFVILTAVRSGEARGATWEEFDLDAGLWTIPAERMKSARPHRVPLSSRAVEIVREMSETKFGDKVFRGRLENRPISDITVNKVLADIGGGAYTVHGFRSSFRDWCGEETSFPRDLAEAALAHAVGDAVERAYRRGDALEKRRKMMEAWCAYCAHADKQGVVPFKVIHKGT